MPLIECQHQKHIGYLHLWRPDNLSQIINTALISDCLHCFRLFALFWIICTVLDYLHCFRLFVLFRIMLTADQSICTVSDNVHDWWKYLHCVTPYCGPGQTKLRHRPTSTVGILDKRSVLLEKPRSRFRLRKNCDCASSPLEKLPLTFPQCVVPRIESLVACQRDWGMGRLVGGGGGSKTGPPTNDYRVGQRPLFCPRDGIQSSPVAEFYPVPSSSVKVLCTVREVGCFLSSCKEMKKSFSIHTFAQMYESPLIWDYLELSHQENWQGGFLSVPPDFQNQN